jgi:hypothetical protein
MLNEVIDHKEALAIEAFKSFLCIYVDSQLCIKQMPSLFGRPSEMKNNGAL